MPRRHDLPILFRLDVDAEIGRAGLAAGSGGVGLSGWEGGGCCHFPFSLSFFLFGLIYFIIGYS